ncbi:DUF3810 domain-containing protein [Intestinibacter sp.]
MKKFRITAYILFIISLIIKYISSKYSYIVENYYSKNIDIYIVKFLSKMSSTFGFSYFEILIYIFVLSILLSIIYIIYRGFKGKKAFLSSLKNILLNYIAVVCFVYFLFIVLWGINYNRIGLDQSIKNEYNISNNQDVSDISFDTDDLSQLYTYLIEKCNENKQKVNNSNNELENDTKSIKQMISKLENGYDNVELLNLNKLGSYSKAKIILNSKLLSYTNITGIYSPFTGEANINTNQPAISIPFTILHEMAHQRGYGNESEANFLSYISCINNDDVYVNYSGYFMALRYTASALSKVDYYKFKSITENIDEDVLKDLREYSYFWEKYEGKVNEVSDNMNNIYLKSNRVKEGTQSYGKVVDLLLLYYHLYVK